MPPESELIKLTQDLLDSIAQGDWKRYTELCDPSLSCFEPEAVGNLVQGLEFHQFYFNLERSHGGTVQNTIAQPHVRLMGDCAVISYIRLTQSLQTSGAAVTKASEETRVWQKVDGNWKHVHFHRSSPTV